MSETKITKRHYDAALTLANRARKVLGKRSVRRLRKGLRGDANACVVAATIGHGIYVDYPEGEDSRGVVYDESTDDVIVIGSRLSGVFLKAFDEGEIPELEKER
jgi:hypothetical protein